MTYTYNKTYARLTLLLLAIEIAIAVCFKTGFIRYTLGDALVVILIYCCCKSFFKFSALPLAIAVLGCAYCIEFAQHFHLLEYIGLTDTYWATLILGSHFSISDLIAYTLGMLLFLVIDLKYINL